QEPFARADQAERGICHQRGVKSSNSAPIDRRGGVARNPFAGLLRKRAATACETGRDESALRNEAWCCLQQGWLVRPDINRARISACQYLDLATAHEAHRWDRVAVDIDIEQTVAARGQRQRIGLV